MPRARYSPRSVGAFRNPNGQMSGRWLRRRRMNYLVGFFNLAGRTPDPEDFEGLSDKTEFERREMGLAPREDLIDGLGEIGFEPPKFVCQVLAERRRRVYVARAVFPIIAWVTHVAVRIPGAFYVKALNPHHPVREGSVLEFGFTESELSSWKVDRADLLTCGSAWTEATAIEVSYNVTRQIELEDADEPSAP